MDLLNINCERYKLKNGLDVILYKDNSLPVVSSNIWYRTGSANEHKGKTGIAHLFENYHNVSSTRKGYGAYIIFDRNKNELLIFRPS